MPRPDPVPPPIEEAALAWKRYRSMMKWMALASVVAVILALVFLAAGGQQMSIHVVIATAAGVGLSVLLGTALMGLVFLSNRTGADDDAAGGGGRKG